MKRVIGLLALSVVTGWGPAPRLTAATPAKPNIIFILADDLGLPALGCTGGIYKTPHLDALAKGGMLFEKAYSAPLCGPTRAQLITGRYAFRTGMFTNNDGDSVTPQKDGSVALRLKEAGYTTAIAGKWRQLSYFTTKEDAAKWGFDEFLIWGAGQPDEDEEPAKGARKKQKEGGAKAATRGDRYWTPDYNMNGKPLANADGKYGPDVLNEFAIDFVRRHKDRPFFVYYPTPLIHGPIMHTPDSKVQTSTKKTGKKAAAEDVGEGSLYADNIAYLDKLVGKLVAELDALGLREKTLIMFGGDNGSVPVGLVHGKLVDGKKGGLTEGGARVPLIANWRGTTPAGVVSKNLVDFSDLLPTFVELAGGKVPATPIVDGRSFAAQLRGQPGNPRPWIYAQLRDERYVRAERFKLTGNGELFDMKEAPHRQILVPKQSEDAEAKAARAMLQAALDRLKPAAGEASTMPKQKRKKA